MSQLFGLVPAGQPVITEPTTVHSPTSFIYSIPPSGPKPFSHIVVFLLPNITLPPNHAAAIHLLTPPTNPGSSFDSTFLGALGHGKASAIFKLSNDTSSGGVAIGISVEPEAAVAQKMEALAARETSKALVPAAGGAVQQGGPTTLQLAQRIISNAFNFLSSYSGTTGPGGVEVVPIKAFEQWWKKFESRVRSDPTFLERDV
ncbi:hypothetical protein QBC40DRAFT_75108 [Triangularia verruculosa]|uniref:Hikeshi-like domain-containing protein n=1 Tax=Triangularia verruculosa TaxID=2587418 RepID=A0AAN7B1I8_9PEZI|nr:hypothetical protein QBC40DRAFT_75108 [Triangularia verruculosa]